MGAALVGRHDQGDRLGTEELFFSVAEAQAADISRAVEAARQAFDAGPWPRLPHAERAGYLRAIGAELSGRSDAIGQIWPRESGVPPRWIRGHDAVVEKKI